MSTHEELLAAAKYLQDRTGDPNAWQTGLAPGDVTAVLTPATGSEQLDAILSKIHRQHADLFVDATPDKGKAADAIAEAEAALAHQNSVSSQLDLQVTAAILNAHLTAVDGSEALAKLQQETEDALHARSDLDTPAGARDFQRFLIGKLRDIRAVVMNASLDDTSKSALMAAWTSLYDASKDGPDVPAAPPAAPVAAPAHSATPQPDDNLDTGWDPALDSALADDPGLPAGDAAGQDPAASPTPPPMPVTPAMPAIPDFGGGSLPGLGAAPGSLGGWGGPGGLPLSGLGGDRPDPALGDDEELVGSHDPDRGDRASSDEPVDAADESKPEAAPAGPTPVTLPDGDTVTAASPQLAAAIKAAVGGAPIAEAFQQQGITIPAPGTAVETPIDPLQVAPGDIGILTDRHALALGHRKALLDGQIQDIATVSGPSFLGWEHPPAASPTATAPARPDTPTPTRPAATSTT